MSIRMWDCKREGGQVEGLWKYLRFICIRQKMSLGRHAHIMPE